MIPSQSCVDLVKQFEGCVLKAYPDPASGGEPWTIGYGHTGGDVKEGLVWSQEFAENMLQADLSKIGAAVFAMLQFDVPQPCFDALVSFAYNLGPQNLKRSTLLAKVNQRDLYGALTQFHYWVNAGGKPMPGLVKRRLAEAALFTKGLE